MERKKKICIISGDPITSRLLSALISSNGFNTHHARFSVDEINNLKNCKPHPHVAIYDVSEHQVANSGLCEFVKKHTISKKIPRIIVSSFEIDCMECLEKQEVNCAYFVKPRSSKELLKKVSEFANSSFHEFYLFPA